MHDLLTMFVGENIGNITVVECKQKAITSHSLGLC